jgi:hypothetical protein
MKDNKRQIQTRANALADKCLIYGGVHYQYDDKDLINASLIFSHILLDVMYTERTPHMTQEGMEEMATLTGCAIRELIMASTGKDMHELVKTVYKHD